MKIYIVTSGDCGECIERVYTDKAKAEARVKLYEDQHLEEYDTSDDEVLMPVLRYSSRTSFDGGGNVTNHKADFKVVPADSNDRGIIMYYRHRASEYLIAITRYIHQLNVDKYHTDEKYKKVAQDIHKQILLKLCHEQRLPKEFLFMLEVQGLNQDEIWELINKEQ